MKRAMLAGAVAISGAIACLATAAAAATLPAIKTTGDNAVPECATPGRLMAFVSSRNGSLDSRFEDIATAYMRHGEAMGIRWDFAFFQMLLETGNLSFKASNGKAGNVKASQYNFAGLGATGKGEPGETFKDLDSGVKAHLQHLMMYAGEHIENPVAERTRKVQEWGVLTSWQKGLKHPVTFADLARQWAPGSHGYGRDIENVGEHFYNDVCNNPDPRPQLVEAARAGRAATTVVAATPEGDKVSGKELMRRDVERARSDGDGARASLGASLPAKPATGVAGTATPPSASTTAVKVINEPDAGRAVPPPATQVAAAGAAAAAGATKAPAASSAKCRVWTASYGGQKSVIIRSSADQLVNFTVLDVNDGQEARETEAYIAAYAKGGQKIAEFSSQGAALDKAFQLCPEG